MNNLISLICKKEYIIECDILGHQGRPMMDYAFRINKKYCCTKSKNPLFLYDFNFYSLTLSMHKEEIDKYFYTTSEIRKIKLEKLQNEK